MKKESKRTKSARTVSQFEEAFSCPICRSSMHVQTFQSLTCDNNHTYDFAKQGYLNLTKGSLQTKYTKALFESRRNLMVEGAFFNPLIKALSEHISSSFESDVSILDMGCGEGTHLAYLSNLLQVDFNNKPRSIGMDISKEGIQVAAKHYPDQTWIVGDLANSPFKNKQFDVILNILSPSNYAEFKELLADDGMLIKVVPRSGYLKELREYFFQDSEKENYSNSETVERFKSHFKSVEVSSLNYTVKLDHQALKWLVEMTPLTWDLTKEATEPFINQDEIEITIDLDILIGSMV